MMTNSDQILDDSSKPAKRGGWGEDTKGKGKRYAFAFRVYIHLQMDVRNVACSTSQYYILFVLYVCVYK